MKIISFLFFFTFSNAKRRSKINKTHHDYSSRSLPKPKTNKKWKEKWNWLQFSEPKDRCLVLCAGNTKKD